MKITAEYDKLPRLVRLVLHIFLGALVGGIYRILRFTETKNVVTLVVGILCLVTGIGNFIIWLLDLITVIKDDKIVYFAD